MDKSNPKKAEKWRMLLASEMVTDTVSELVALLVYFLQAVSLDPRYFDNGKPYEIYSTR